MAKQKKEEVEEKNVVEPQVEVQPELAQAVEETPANKESKKDSKKEEIPADEVTFVAPHDVYRVQQEGEVLEADNLHVVVQGRDGKKYAVPYDAVAHKNVKAGDKLSF